jgi:hypothetical protein
MEVEGVGDYFYIAHAWCYPNAPDMLGGENDWIKEVK